MLQLSKTDLNKYLRLIKIIVHSGGSTQGNHSIIETQIANAEDSTLSTIWQQMTETTNIVLYR